MSHCRQLRPPASATNAPKSAQVRTGQALTATPGPILALADTPAQGPGAGIPTSRVTRKGDTAGGLSPARMAGATAGGLLLWTAATSWLPAAAAWTSAHVSGPVVAAGAIAWAVAMVAWTRAILRAEEAA